MKKHLFLRKIIHIELDKYFMPRKSLYCNVGHITVIVKFVSSDVFGLN